MVREMCPNVELPQLSQVANTILDFLLNVPNIYDQVGAIETVELMTPKYKHLAQPEWDLLVEKGVITKLDYHFIVNPALIVDTKSSLEQYLKDNSVTQKSIADYLQSRVEDDCPNLTLFANLRGRVFASQNIEQITFSDYDWPRDLISACDELTKHGITFKTSSQSKKHYYTIFYLRSWPFDAGKIMWERILSNLNVEGLTNEEWKVLFILFIAGDPQVPYKVLTNNMNLTDPELREIVTNLCDKGLINESSGYISVPKALASSLSGYFKANVYPGFKDKVTEQVKKKISSSLSNLWLFTGAKRINELGVRDIISNPVPAKLVDKSKIKAHEPQFQDMSHLGLIVDLESKILVISDIVKDIENWLRSSINASIIFIPAKDHLLARRVLRDIFSKCQNYVKIQDAYLGEETFEFLEYISQGVQIQLLSGIKLGDKEDPSKVCQKIERFKSERKDKFDIFFVGKSGGATPFHDRFIISSNNCWTTGTSLKQIGSEKATAITEFSKDKSGEEIELAFDAIWFADSDELKARGYDKLDFETWKNIQFQKKQQS